MRICLSGISAFCFLSGPLCRTDKSGARRISKDAEVFNMKCDPKDLLLYAVTDRHWLNGRTLVDVVKESLDGGVTMIQLREKVSG